MTISDIKELFEQKFSNHFDKLSVISKDNQFSLCNFKNQFLNFDSIAKEYYSSWASTDMIFFDLEREYIIFVEYKNSKMKSKEKPKIKQKFLDSFALLHKILETKGKEEFWHFKTYLLFVTNKDKNQNQENNRAYLGSEKLLDILESDIILYGFERYKGWYFDEIKTPFCDEFPTLMETEFNIQLEPE
ncbi:MAG: hypothetical protein OMM_05399 [Candidatus Magnetoglobus multicellularis str. Araruama]|uniref:Uncharacterized protein n=1 Tax=Candidatus Magnetoglobus multicellularis str. Araruama TaxID=890399 RepID=A0A1V1NWM0_9BACT|nr:MAG: hypothetical protein OMM_05399 [Candidatus Magnetoglobus multicellularis str. Araruama]